MPGKYLLKKLARCPLGTYADVICRQALLRPDQTAFQYGEQIVTFARFNGRVNALVQALHSLGLRK